MTTTFEVFKKIQKKLAALGTECTFDIERCESDESECFDMLCAHVGHVLAATRFDPPDEDEDGVALDPLSIQTFKSDNGDYILDIDVTVGGPTVSVRFESRWGTATISAHWGASHLVVSTKDAPLIDLLQWVSD